MTRALVQIQCLVSRLKSALSPRVLSKRVVSNEPLSVLGVILDCGDNVTPGPASSPACTRCRSRHVTEATVICAGQGKFIPSCVDGTGAAFWNQRISFTLEEAREGQGKKNGLVHM